ncbi:GIY-YIG nuclease family protein [Candidatus Thiodiazotropha sp. CDECU1]|uniref:GIY-YIG nuclease family protein n=1 Tax=Candidatus Thiodiazotropha sp. CDECU1 TaxID=3065865 RepID=UPI00292CAD86|nr:GIY-YIG nuclease family protein [Candidatus Thiodiazotropha sp. CDECU1]
MTKRADHQSWYVYIVQCADRTLYTGITKDIDKRVTQHNSGSGAKYTRGRVPVELVFAEGMESHGDALRREYEIKRMSLAGKRKIIEVSRTEKETSLS